VVLAHLVELLRPKGVLMVHLGLLTLQVVSMVPPELLLW
jgi:hypothetical protein